VLDAAVWNPIDATGLRLTVAVTPAAGGGRDLALQVAADDIAFQRQDDRWNAAWTCGWCNWTPRSVN